MSTLRDGMQWFKNTFGDRIRQGADGTPFGLNFLTALATQETFEVWGRVFGKLPEARILEICVGDVIDAPARTAFPVDKVALLGIADGAKIFAVARAALEDMGQYVPEYGAIAKAHPDKFCHGFGIFQYDIQFSKPRDDPGFFLNKDWYGFEACLAKSLEELKEAQARAKLAGLQQLDDMQSAYVAIAYNAGHFDPAKGLKQGFYDKNSGKYYGELIHDYIELAAQVGGDA